MKSGHIRPQREHGRGGTRAAIDGRDGTLEKRPKTAVTGTRGGARKRKKEVSVLEGGTSDELAHDGGGRDFLVAHGYEVMDELEKAVGLAILRTILGH